MPVFLITNMGMSIYVNRGEAMEVPDRLNYSAVFATGMHIAVRPGLLHRTGSAERPAQDISSPFRDREEWRLSITSK